MPLGIITRIHGSGAPRIYHPHSRQRSATDYRSFSLHYYYIRFDTVCQQKFYEIFRNKTRADAVAFSFRLSRSRALFFPQLFS